MQIELHAQWRNSVRPVCRESVYLFKKIALQATKAALTVKTSPVTVARDMRELFCTTSLNFLVYSWELFDPFSSTLLPAVALLKNGVKRLKSKQIAFVWLLRWASLTVLFCTLLGLVSSSELKVLRLCEAVGVMDISLNRSSFSDYVYAVSRKCVQHRTPFPPIAPFSWTAKV